MEYKETPHDKNPDDITPFLSTHISDRSVKAFNTKLCYAFCLILKIY